MNWRHAIKLYVCLCVFMQMLMEPLFAALCELLYVCLCVFVQMLMEPLFAALCELPIFHVCERGGVTRWARVTECVFDCLHHDDTDTRSLVISTLLNAGVTVAVNVQPHLLLALGAYGKHTPETVSPALVRAHLRQSPAAYRHLPWQSKLCLLSFILKDECFEDLGGICMLPLLDGSFTEFMRTKGAEAVYLPTSEFPAELLPGLEKLLVCAVDVGEFLQDKLRKIVQSGEYMICRSFDCSICHH